ncbi:MULTISPECIES: helix-turn-helix domain-containing protein [Streptomyces]|uniref:Helix-turn-helix domain-containing protein n=1 Tax=Streptomyces ramulosus TaxID=47762 RepID=A0ABW1FNM8_9ACTN
MTKDDGEGSFAAMLRELKGRSGQSYGTLAKRLHVSTSTLHRYCNGDAVPAEFAPAERLGRFCGAKPDELVELHRRWILASAARSGKKRPAGGEREEAPEPETAAVPTPGAASAASGTRAEPTPGPEPEQTAKSPSEPVSGGTAGRQPEWARDAAAASSATAMEPPAPEMIYTPPAVHPDEAAAGNAAHSVPVPADLTPDERAARNAAAPPPAKRAPRPAARADREAAGNAASAVPPKASRQRRPLLIAAAVAVVAALAATATYGLSGDDAANRVTTARDGKTQNDDAPGDGTPSATAKEKEKETGKKADGKEKDGEKDASASPGKGGQAPSGDPSAGSGSGHSGDGIPLTANVRPYVWGDELPCFQTFLINRPPENMPGTPQTGDTVGWARGLGGVDAEHSRIGVVVRGTEKEPVVLEALRVQVVGRGPALGWQHYNPSGGCGGGLTPSSYSIALDNTSPVVKAVPGEQAGKTIPAKPFPRTVSSTEPEALAIRADAVSCDCSWYLELDWSSGKRSGTLPINDGGRPFRTSGAAAKTTYTYGGDPAKWWGDS